MYKVAFLVLIICMKLSIYIGYNCKSSTLNICILTRISWCTKWHFILRICNVCKKTSIGEAQSSDNHEQIFFFTYVYRALTIDFQFIKAVSTVYRAVTIFLSETVYKAVTIVHVYIRLYVRYYRAGQLCIQSSDNFPFWKLYAKQWHI